MSNAGNDANDGLSPATPWRTYARAEQEIYPPGASVLGRAGDVFNESFTPKGNGINGTGWITLGRYGAGPNPVLDGMGVLLGGVKFDNIYSVGGWKIDGVDFQNYLLFAIDFECFDRATQGIFIDNTTMDRITGAPVISSGFPTDGSALYPTPGYHMCYPNAIFLWKVDNVILGTIRVTNSDGAIWTNGCNNVQTVGAVTTDTTYRSGIVFASIPKTQTFTPAVPNVFYFGPGGHYTSDSIDFGSNFQLLRAGAVTGMWWGTTALQVNNCSNVSWGPGEIGFVQRPGSTPDGVGFDIEGETTNVVVDGLDVHDCEGSGFLLFNHVWDGIPPTQTGTQILNSTFRKNGTLNPAALPLVMRLVANLSNNVVVTGNTFDFAGVAGQFLNDCQGQVSDPNGLQNTWPARFTVSGNTIIP